MKYYFYWIQVIAIFFLKNNQATAQALSKGDSFPSGKMRNVLNTASGILDIDQLKSKLIILDFWSTSCFSCLEAFPKMDSLQKKFGDRVQIIGITSNSADSIQRFYKRFPKLYFPSFPMVTDDSVYARLFPHIVLPHHVWIDSTKKVKFITYDWTSRAETIEQYLSGELIDNDVALSKKDTIIDGPINDLIIERTGFYSVLTHAMGGVRFGSPRLSTEEGNIQPNGLCSETSSIGDLFARAYSEDGRRFNFDVPATRVYESLGSIQMNYASSEKEMMSWIRNYSFNYFLKVPPSQAHLLYERMREDLSGFFNIIASVQKRKIPCFIITRTSQRDKLRTGGAASKYSHRNISKDSLIYLHDRSMPTVVASLQELLMRKGFNYPVVDQTSYPHNIDFAIPDKDFETLTLASLQKIFETYDLKLTIRPIERPVLVLKRRGGKDSVIVP